ncbi:succinyldiaminopimelate transaminase [uncultured Corynebacterium sp.]|uniref:succinyldiaminopimelate transaminase n=1 Tax=uncultured Corynebacterium sp. TaxID=159447 RepID=UPI00259BC61C|nr:succinyldiaminopimelate transaminase [uncultured Corynebacterium sp.]
MSTHHRAGLEEQLPEFPWDTILDVKQKAASHPGGLIDLSVGTPVDSVDPSIQLALAEHAAAPGYPPTQGSAELRQAIADSLERRYNIQGLHTDAVLPVIGTKEAVAWLPTLLNLRGGIVVIPEIAYPTYEVAAIIAGCKVVRSDVPVDGASLVFLNTPSNPTGRVLSAEEMRVWVDYARETGAIIASDECYMGLAWDEDRRPVSLLDPAVSGGDNTNLLVLHSLSKTSNMASYRVGFIAGDEKLVQELLLLRKHTGMMVPGPIQAATLAALRDDQHETLQRLRYANRRVTLLRALLAAGCSVEHSEAGLYLWTRREGADARQTLDWFAQRGILVAPGDFYGPGGSQHVRVGLTASDEAIAEAAQRLSE